MIEQKGCTNNFIERFNKKITSFVCILKFFSYLCSAFEKQSYGSLAEWLGTGLQNRLQQFESARNL